MMPVCNSSESLGSSGLDCNETDVMSVTMSCVYVCVCVCVCGGERGLFNGRGCSRLLPDVTALCVCACV